MGFRYDGELKSIHHVESYSVIDNYAPDFVRKSWPLDRPHFVYELGPAIKPATQIPTNGGGQMIYRSGRKWVAIDLLLTASSIAEAALLTKQRLERNEDQDQLVAIKQTEGAAEED
jgi:hypothetical protein